MNRQKFSQGMAGLCEIYEREPSKVLLEAYWTVLKDMSDQDFDQAIGQLLRSRVYTKLPLPADILDAAYGKAEDRAQIALKKLHEAIRGHGAYSNVIFDDPVIHAIVEREGGWEKLNEKETSEFKFWDRDFVKMYVAYAPRISEMTISPVLTGIDIGKLPIFIGDKQKALAWIANQDQRKELKGAEKDVKSLVAGIAEKRKA